MNKLPDRYVLRKNTKIHVSDYTRPFDPLLDNRDYPTDGLYYLETDGQAKWICTPIMVVAYTRDKNDSNWGIKIELVNPMNEEIELLIDMRCFSSQVNEQKLLQLLFMNGVKINSKKKYRQYLLNYLQMSESSERLLINSDNYDTNYIFTRGQ